MKINKNSIINLMIVCIPLCPYKLFSIGEKDISCIYIVWLLLVLFSLLDINNILRALQKNWIIIITILYFVLNSYITKSNKLGAIWQFVAIWSIWFLSYRKVTKEQFQNTIRIFQKFMDIMAIYGIYEFIGRIFNLPFSDPWIKNHMVEGYNWYNSINIGKVELYRSNAIFVEPSMFAQFLAINIMLYLLPENNKYKKCWSKIIINLLALICTMSGTGIIMVFLGIFIYLTSKGGIKTIINTLYKYKEFMIAFALVFLIILFSPLGKYLISRLSEFNPTNTQSVSGYIRFVGQFNIVNEVWKTNFIWGLGIGNVQSFIDIYRMTGSATAFASTACSMILARFAAELGIVGVVLLVLSYKHIFKGEKIFNNYYRILVICVFIMIFLSDSAVNTGYWCLMYILNIDLNSMQVENY